MPFSNPAFWPRGFSRTGFYSLKTAYANPIPSGDIGTWRGSASTTDATPAPVVLYTPAPSQVVLVKFRCTALKTDGTKAASWEIAAGFRCDASGTLTMVGSATSVATAADASFAPTAALSASGANIIATLTGVAATNIAWNFTTQII